MVDACIWHGFSVYLHVHVNHHLDRVLTKASSYDMNLGRSTSQLSLLGDATEIRRDVRMSFANRGHLNSNTFACLQLLHLFVGRM